MVIHMVNHEVTWACGVELYVQLYHVDLDLLDLAEYFPVPDDMAQKCDCAIQLRNELHASKSTSHPKTMNCGTLAQEVLGGSVGI